MTADGKSFYLVELCEEETFIEEGRKNIASGGSLNTFENMIELFVCFAYIRDKISLPIEVKDVYHCAGSGKAQVFRASANTFPLPTDIDSTRRFFERGYIT